MKSISRAGVTVLLLLTLCLASAAAGEREEKNPEKIELSLFWFGEQHQIPVWEKILKNFNDRHPAFNVVPLLAPPGSTNVQQSALLASYDPPAVMAFTDFQMLDLSRAGAFVDLKPLIERDGVDLNAFFRPFREMVTFEDKIYSLPFCGGFDIIYACQDIEADRAQGLFSLPARLGPARALAVARLAHLATVVLLVSLGHLAPLGWLYYIGVAIVAILLAVENGLVHADDFSRVNVAFFTINGVISVLLGVLAIVDVLLELGVPPS